MKVIKWFVRLIEIGKIKVIITQAIYKFCDTYYTNYCKVTEIGYLSHSLKEDWLLHH